MKNHTLLAVRCSDLLGALWFLSTPQFCSNSAGVACTMKESKYNNLAVFHPEVNGIWKSFEQTPSIFVIHLLVEKWIVWNLTSISIKHPQEFLAEPQCFLSVPYIPVMTSSSTSGRKCRVYVISFVLSLPEVLQETEDFLD